MNIRDLKKDITFLANDIAMTIVINNSIKADNTEKASELMVKVAVFKSEFTKKAVPYGHGLLSSPHII
jgi:hypothetical protein